MDASLEQLTNERMLAELDATSKQPLAEQVEHLRTIVDQWCKPHGPKDDVSILATEIL